MQTQAPLSRTLRIKDATALNMVTMVGSAIFVTLPLRPLCDGRTSSDAGMTAWHGNCDGRRACLGGTRHILSRKRWSVSLLGRGLRGRELATFLSFPSLWGYAIIMPLISAFTAVSFAQYCQQFWPAMTSAETGQLNSFPHRTSLTAYRLDSGLGASLF